MSSYLESQRDPLTVSLHFFSFFILYIAYLKKRIFLSLANGFNLGCLFSPGIPPRAICKEGTVVGVYRGAARRRPS